MSLNRNLARASILAIGLLLTACAASSPPAPILQTQVIKEKPPAELLNYPPAPVIPEKLTSRDEYRSAFLAVAAWASELRSRLDAVKAWGMSVDAQ